MYFVIRAKPATDSSKTSKTSAQTAVHGGQGFFLASLSAISLLSITSHHHQHHSHSTLSMHNSEVISRQLPALTSQYLSRSDHGTRVTVRNLFGNMPVRVKQRAIVAETQGALSKEWERLKSTVVLLCLAWPRSVAITLRDLATNQKMAIRGTTKTCPRTEIPRVCGILFQSSYITPDEKASWVSVGASTSTIEVSGAISLDPSPTKLIQFLAFDIQPIVAFEGQNLLHDEINRLFINSTFGNEVDSERLDETERSRRVKDARYKNDGYTNNELKGGKKGVDRWPMFYINIQHTTSPTVTNRLDVDDILDDRSNSLTSIMELLQAMIREFLTRHHFTPKTHRSQQSRGTNGRLEEISIKANPQSPRNCKTVTFAMPPSQKAPPPNKVDRKATKIRNTNSELLGTNVKLPSFNKSSSFTDSPFDTWSKIKSGTARPALYKSRELGSGDEIQRPSTAPPLSLSPAIESQHPRVLTPLISSTGKVTRWPFEDIPPCSSRLKSASLQRSRIRSFQPEPAITQPPPSPIDLTEDSDDDIVAWVNPITKVKSIVNRRTGHTALATKNEIKPSLVRPSSTPNFSTRSKHNATMLSKPPQPSPWIANLLHKWDNPVFHPTELAIPQVSINGESEQVLHGQRHNCTQFDISRAFTEASSGISGRISKSALRNAEVIGQVDRKFILVKLLGSPGGHMLVIIDQHAADERIRVESLLSQLCTPALPRPDGMPSESGIATMYLEKDVVFEVSEKDVELLRKKRAHFATWGMCYDLLRPSVKPKNETGKSTATHAFTVRALPPPIIERCKADPKILIDLIRTELYSTSKNIPDSTTTLPSFAHFGSEQEEKDWLRRIGACPQGIIDMINSRACRSAIMFNDALSKMECELLVRRLSETAFPFQCAHGRPSLSPLVELGSVPHSELDIGEDCGIGYGKAFSAWKRSLQKQ